MTMWRARTADKTASVRTRLLSAANSLRAAKAASVGAKTVMSSRPSATPTKSWATRAATRELRVGTSAAVAEID